MRDTYSECAEAVALYLAETEERDAAFWATMRRGAVSPRAYRFFAPAAPRDEEPTIRITAAHFTTAAVPMTQEIAR